MQWRRPLPAAAAERARQFDAIAELLTAAELGTCESWRDNTTITIRADIPNGTARPSGRQRVSRRAGI